MDDTSEAELSDIHPAGEPLCTPPKVTERERATAKVRRTSRLDVRLTEAERAAVDRRARMLGVKPSRWARAVLTDALDARRASAAAIEIAALIAKPPDGMPEAVEQLRRVGVNLNQVVRRGLPVDERLLHRVLDEVQTLRAALGDEVAL